MRKSAWTPSIVPDDNDQNVCIVVDDFGRTGRAYRETDVERTDLEAVIMDMLEGQYQNCAPAATGNTATCRSIWKSLLQHEGRYHDIQLPLPMRLV